MARPAVGAVIFKEAHFPVSRSAVPSYLRYERGVFRRMERALVQEASLTVEVNGQEIATLICSPYQFHDVVVGFLFLESLIQGVEDVLALHVEDGVARVRLRRDPPPRLRKVRTSGCTGGMTFALNVELPPVTSQWGITPEQALRMMKEMHENAEAYRATGGIHTSALSDGTRLLCVASDVGRHNTIDRIAGVCLRRGVATEDTMLLSSGRISSEMLLKAVRLRVPIVVSHTSPTNLAVELGKELGVTVIGYCRGGALNVYTNPWRIYGATEITTRD
ncbi:MAG: formate dehydrogenase accessory sulfurtransferase FdhD [Abditibacteriales bacterium]|nr:formate dehydrogenase accessory sulfurtransferase FdhD [Abditibacteriales bacterium]MDW8364757.1 formate dehydrogenase accessory sulfurtransferase FdhD [Abditibacteriales bacterium]